ncbi:hypothetical protein ACH5RR_024242 [Cinchona calisaya]|uniref:Uncharacterized protein n=1 Tax=Cinchona calisaya TaxID=153742 RepID=A0ABD2YZM7_9GENT
MGKKVIARRVLLERWRGIEEEDDDDQGQDLIKRRRLRQLKEEWFSDAFNFLVGLPNDKHIWCGFWDLMGPLLETFYNYSNDEPCDSSLKILWARISEEMQHCSQCICQHHQTQETYNAEYEPSSIGPLLEVVRTLDEERISKNLNDINAKVTRGEYNPAHENAEVVCVMFEVLMFPYLLDDQSLAAEFEKFIEAIDNSHELTLAGHQHYPGVYALLFLKSRRARSIGFRMAGHMGKLRRSADLDPLQPLLKKCIDFLETEIMPSAAEACRPRVQLDRITVWLGIKALLGFLEPPVFEEGILDRYPVFLSIVLNHITDDSLEFSYAVNCLRLLFEMLGCKLWLRSSLPPSVMRNTLLGQCFHTQNEKSHKEIFDLFQPFLQSLEALQDGEHEKQRRHFLYFLLHQVTVSSNFSILMRKKACQIALLIVHRGYKMRPPCPPYECAHMWGPSLVSSLKDSSLHISLRQPAFDLIQALIVSDASALVATILNEHLLLRNERVILIEGNDENEELFFDNDIEEETSCWNGFHLQSKSTMLAYEEWLCIPMLWFDVLVGIDPLILPLSFAKAVFWAISRFSMVEAENSSAMSVSIGDLMTTCASELSHLFQWKVPSGSDDGGDGAESKNSISVSKMYMPLIRIFRRLTSHYIVRMEQGGLRKQWTWEPMMADSLILLLVDPNDNERQVSRVILEQLSGQKGLTCGLQFLCSSQSSLSAIFLGLGHALKLVHLDSVLLNFQTLHHLFFVLCKLIKEGNSSTEPIAGSSPGVINVSQFSSQGGFLRQPVFNSKMDNLNSSVVSSTVWEKFCLLVSEMAWPSVLKCLAKGKAFKDHKISQMTSVRLLEILPVIFGKLCGDSGIMMKVIIDMKWLHDLMDWGRSSLAVVSRYWKQTLFSLLGLLKKSCCNISASAIRSIEKLLSSDNVTFDEMNDQVASLSLLLMDEGCFTYNKSNMKSESLFFKELLPARKFSVEIVEPFSSKGAEMHAIDSEKLVGKERTNVVILPDDDKEPVMAAIDKVQSHLGMSLHSFDDKVGCPNPVGRTLCSNKEHDSGTGFLGFPSQTLYDGGTKGIPDLIVQKPETTDKPEGRQQPAPHIRLTSINSKEKEIYPKHSKNYCCPVQSVSELKLSDESSLSGRTGSSKSELGCNLKTSVDTNNFKSKDQQGIDKVLGRTETVINEVVYDREDDSWEFAFFKSARPEKSLFSKPRNTGAKRQVIQLNLPVENRFGNWRVNVGTRRFKAPRLDDWYKPILELDYFATVGLASEDKAGKMVSKLKEVPVCFKSPDEYVEVFRPLILEEFKAQLHSSFEEMASVDEMCHGDLSVLSVERIDDFHIVRCVHDDIDSAGSRSFLENDLVLLTRKSLPRSSHDVHMVGKVERREIDNKRKLGILVIRLYLQNGCSRLNRARKFLVERSKWCISRLMSITPQLREFQALSSLREIPLLPIILNPTSHLHGVDDSRRENLGRLSQPLQLVLKSSYNGCQLKAISAAIGSLDLRKDFELSLIQGPPGTGKTRTILGIVSGLLALSQTRDEKRSASRDPYCATMGGMLSRSQMNQSAAIARAWQDAALAKQLHEDEARNTESTGCCARGRVLICAQSNAAVDELVSRISTEGLNGCDGLMYKPYLVRVGNGKSVHPNSLPFFIDTLVDQRVAKERVNDGKTEASSDSVSVLRSNLESLVDRIRFYEVKRANLRDGDSKIRSLLDGTVEGDDMQELTDTEVEAKLRILYDKKKAIYKDLSHAQAQDKKASEESKALKHKLRRAILKEAEVVVTTLSGCGGDLYGVCAESISSHKFSSSSESTLFDAVVIDEAAQALEPATLIPLQLLKSKGTRCIMVGDPKQLPATVLSNIASKYLFQCSMFERLQRAGHPVIMLTQQYRMHPEICRFPALHFYDGKLKNGDQMSSKAATFHETLSLGPYMFFDVIDGQECHGKNSGSLSLYNECEADAAVEVLRFFKKRYPLEFVGVRIGVITPYKSQLSVLRSRFSSAFGSAILGEMEFNTVDGFQGREVDILVLSTVRAAELCSQSPRFNSSSIGFVADVRRMNVALTRAKFSLWIFGNARTLQTNENWASLLKDAKERKLARQVRRPYNCIFKSAASEIPAVEGPGNNLRQLQCAEKVKAVGKQADLQKKNVKDTCEKKRKYITSEAPVDAVTGEREHVLPSLETTVKESKRKVMNNHDVPLIKNVASAVVEDNESQISKGLNSSFTRSQVSNDGTSGNRISAMKIKEGAFDVGNGKMDGNLNNDTQHLEKVKSENYKHLKRVVSLKCLEPSKHGKRPLKMDAVLTPPERSLKVVDRSDLDEASGLVELPKDTTMKRKQQRDAVDALLSSSLISSKKPQSSAKSVPVRTLSSASVENREKVQGRKI